MITDIMSSSDLDSSVVLEQAVPLPNGLYSVPLMVKDLQGFGKEQTVNVRVCSCEREENGAGICGARSASTSLGSLGVLALVLSSLLLLLLCECPLLAMTTIYYICLFDIFNIHAVYLHRFT